MLDVLAVVFSMGLLLLFGVKLLRRRKAGSKSAGPARGPTDAWVEDDALARELGRKLDLGADAARRTLRGDPEPDAVSAMEAAVARVELAYVRLPVDGEAEVRVEIAFEDGTAYSTAKRLPWSEIPDDVRDELARTGGGRVYRPWHFPWGAA